MPALPKVMLIDLDETILTFGNRQEMLIRVAEEFAAQIAPLTASEIGASMERALDDFWDDPTRHKEWRFKLLDSRILIAQMLFEKLRHKSPGLTPELAVEFGTRFHDIRTSRLAAFPGAIEALDQFKQLGIRTALITNGAASVQRQKVDQFELAPRFDHIQIEGEVGFGKPEPRAYLHALEVLGASVTDCWMIGDNLDWEIAAPQELGIYSVWVDAARKGLPGNTQVRPDRIITNLAELLP